MWRMWRQRGHLRLLLGGQVSVDREPVPEIPAFLADALAKQRAYEVDRRDWREAHPLVTREEIEWAERSE